jgi:hypothetical protein
VIEFDSILYNLLIIIMMVNVVVEAELDVSLVAFGYFSNFWTLLWYAMRIQT